MRLLNIFLIMIFGLAMQPASAIASTNNSIQSHESIMDTVKQFLSESMETSKNIEIETRISRLDPRLRLNQCITPLVAFSHSDIQQKNRFSVGIKCEDIKSWSLYVNVIISRFTNIYVTAHPLARGESLSLNSIRKVKRNISSLRSGYYINADKLIGMIAKRSIRAGTAIAPKYLRPPTIVKRGDKVKILAQTSGVEIRMAGKAMSDGARGETIKVRNISSKRLVDAVIINAGAVKIVF